MTFRFQAWPTEFRFVTQLFGENPDAYGRFGLAGHEGVDVRAHGGTNVFAVAPGTVRAVHAVLSHPYGLHVRIDHEEGYQTIYAHLSRVSVQAGEHVDAGEVIGQAGSTGNSTAAHLHLSLKRAGAQTAGYPAGIVDPWPFLEAVMLEEAERARRANG